MFQKLDLFPSSDEWEVTTQFGTSKRCSLNHVHTRTRFVFWYLEFTKAGKVPKLSNSEWDRSSSQPFTFYLIILISWPRKLLEFEEWRILGCYLVFLRSVRWLLVTASVVPTLPILVTLMKEALSSSETSVHTSTTHLHFHIKSDLHHRLLCQYSNISNWFVRVPWEINVYTVLIGGIWILGMSDIGWSVFMHCR
jgi:hypothetical protein